MIDKIEAYVVPRVQEAFSRLLVLGDEHGFPLETEKGVLLALSYLSTKLYFKASYATEWVNELTDLGKEGIGYPFLFVNTNGIRKEGSTYTIREMVLATASDPRWVAEEKRLYVFDPILYNLRNALIDALRDVFAVDEPFDPQTEDVYSEKERSKLPEGVDAIVFTNIKLRTIC